MREPEALRGEALAAALRADALGGRVVHAPFLDPPEADALLRAVRAPGVAAEAWGGYAGARRRVVTVRPEHVPRASAALVAWYVPGCGDAEALRAALLRAGVTAGSLGDAVRHTDGCSLVALAGVEPPTPLQLEGRSVAPEPVPVERVAAGSSKRLRVVVPALRVDVLGARAFGVSRSWFAKGVAAGHVRVNGAPADKRSEAGPGDEVWAEGMGRFRVCSLEGATRKGNHKVELEVERA